MLDESMAAVAALPPFHFGEVDGCLESSILWTFGPFVPYSSTGDAC